MFYPISNTNLVMGGIKLNQKLFLSVMAAAVAMPVAVAPMTAQAADPQTQIFKDVPKTHPYFTIIQEMATENIINGYQDGTFRPNNAIKRSHVAALLARALPLEPVREAKEFKDVPKTHPYYEAIQKVQRAGIIDGSDGHFNPDQPLTRVQMAKILTLAFDLKVKATYDFPDVATTHWGSDYVRALYSNGITTGSNGYYKPQEQVSRAHYAVFLHRLLNIDPDFVPEPKPDPKPPVTGGDMPKAKDIVPPKGWTPKETEKNLKKFEDFLENAPVSTGSNGSGYSVLSSDDDIERYFSSSRLESRVKGVNDRGANITPEEYKAIVLDLLKNGGYYEHPSGVFALFFDFEQKRLHNAIVSIKR